MGVWKGEGRLHRRCYIFFLKLMTLGIFKGRRENRVPKDNMQSHGDMKKHIMYFRV